MPVASLLMRTVPKLRVDLSLLNPSKAVAGENSAAQVLSVRNRTL
jgi:hypothetical protein